MSKLCTCIIYGITCIIISDAFIQDWHLMNNSSIHPNMFLGSEIHRSELNLEAYLVISALQKCRICRCNGKVGTNFGQEFHIPKQENNAHIDMCPETFNL
jgi:hypothetical protein